MSSRVVIPILEGLEQNDKPLIKQVVKGIKQIQHQAINSQSHSTTQTTFNFQPPSQNTVIDRRFELEMDVRLETSLGANTMIINPDSQPSVDGIVPGVAGALKQTIGVKRSNFRTALRTVGSVPAVNKVANAATLVVLAAGFNAACDALNGATNVSLSAGDAGSGGAPISYGNNLAPSQFPLTSCMESIDLVINGTHFSVSVAQYIHAIMTYTTPEWREANFPQTQHAPDNVKDFNAISGTNLNPLSLLGEDFRRGETPRGAALSTMTGAVNSAADANSAFTFNFREPLFISPLASMLGHGLTNVSQIDVTIRWAADIQKRMFKYFSLTKARTDAAVAQSQYFVGNNTVYPDESTMKVVFPNTQARLNVLYYTPQDDVNIPNEIILAYKQPQIETVSCGKGAGKLAAGLEANGNNIRLNQVPESVYLYICNRHSAKSMNNPDNFSRVTGIDIRWKNQTGILSGYGEKDLIELAKYNGYDATIEEVMNGANGIAGSAYAGGNPVGKGLVLKLNFGQDIPLDDNESAGTRGDYNWQCNVKFDSRNLAQLGGDAQADANTDLVFYQIFILNGHAIISPNECRVSTGVLSLEDNMNATEMGHSYSLGGSAVGGSEIGGSVVGGSAVGGSLIGGNSSHLQKLLDLGQRGISAGKSAYGMGQQVSKAGQCVKDSINAYKSRA